MILYHSKYKKKHIYNWFKRIILAHTSVRYLYAIIANGRPKFIFWKSWSNAWGWIVADCSSPLSVEYNSKPSLTRSWIIGGNWFFWTT